MIEEGKYNILVTSRGRVEHLPFKSYHELQKYFVSRDGRDSEWDNRCIIHGENGRPPPRILAIWHFERIKGFGERREMNVECHMWEFRETRYCKKHDTFLIGIQTCDGCLMDMMQQEDQMNAEMAHVERQEDQNYTDE